MHAAHNFDHDEFPEEDDADASWLDSIPVSSIKQSRRSSYGGVVDSPVAGIIDEPIRIRYPKSAPGSPERIVNSQKSPGAALVSVSRFVLDEPQLPMLNLEQQEMAERQPKLGLKAARVVRRSAMAEPPARVSGRGRRENSGAPTEASNPAPRVRIADQPRKPRLTVPMASVPRFMQPTASARQRAAAKADQRTAGSGTAAVRQAPAARDYRTVTETNSRPYERQQPPRAHAHRASTHASKARTAPAAVVTAVPAHRASRQSVKLRAAPAVSNFQRTTIASANNASRPARSSREREMSKPAARKSDTNRAPSGVTIPETPTWARNRSRERRKVLSTEEREMQEAERARQKLAAERRAARERLAARQQQAGYEGRYLRVASNFSPAPVTAHKNKEGRTNRKSARPEQRHQENARPQLTNPEPFRFQTDARRKYY